MELRDALTQISEIRSQMARAQVFRGYRSATAAFSGVVALVTAGLQSVLIADPLHQIAAYVMLWFGAALVAMLVVGIEMVIRSRRLASPVQSQLTILAVEQFLPAVVAGGLLTVVFVNYIPEAVALLPGLWMVCFSLGVFSSCRLLPRASFVVAAFYLLAGLAVLIAARGPVALEPWVMGVPFAAGQFLAAAILHRALERRHEV